MPRFLAPAFAVAFLCLLAAATVASTFTPGVYDCGPYRNKFEIRTCDSRVCNLFTYNQGTSGAGFTSTMDLASLQTMLSSGAPGGTACRMVRNSTGRTVGAALPGADAYKPKVIKAGSVAPGRYECFTFSGGHLYAAMSENFTILGSSAYRDWSGRTGAYSFSAGSQTIAFRGAALGGRRAKYRAGWNAATPTNVTFYNPRGELADSCDKK